MHKNVGGKEPLLVRVNGEDHVTCHMGGLVMNPRQVRLGEERVNRALWSLIARHRSQHAPLPRLLDLVAAHRAEARTAEEQQLIADLRERITLYHLQVQQPTAVQPADGRWEVTLPVEARKLYAHGKWAETETPLAEAIEIGVFAAAPGAATSGAKDVHMLERRLARSGVQTFTFVAERRPLYASVDPYTYRVDRKAETTWGSCRRRSRARMDSVATRARESPSQRARPMSAN